MKRRPGGSALDHRTISWPEYAVSQRIRKEVEEIFGWIRQSGTSAAPAIEASFAGYLVVAAYNTLFRRMNRDASEPHLPRPTR